MFQMKLRRRRLEWMGSFFMFGALSQFFLWRSYLHVSESQGGVVDNSLTNVALIVLAGSFVCFLMMRLLRTTLERVVVGFVEVMAKAGLCGLVATLCTYESLFLLIAAYGAINVTFFSGQSYAPAVQSLFFSFVIFFQDIQIEGALAIAWCSPFAFFLSSIAGVAIWIAWKKRILPAEPVIGS